MARLNLDIRTAAKTSLPLATAAVHKSQCMPHAYCSPKLVSHGKGDRGPALKLGMPSSVTTERGKFKAQLSQEGNDQNQQILLPTNTANTLSNP